MNQNVLSCIKKIEDQIAGIYNRLLAHQYAWWLVQAVTKKNKGQLVAQEALVLSSEQQQKLDEWLHQLITEKKPLQYILGTIPFGQLEIIVEPPVLIPRPETEEWVLWLLEKLKPVKNERLHILDIGTGSGAIGLSLAHALPNATIIATDIAIEALQLSAKNAEKNDIKNFHLIESDLFANIPKQDKFDLIVSNPPYIAPDEWQELDQSVKKWEDKRALLADREGLAIIDAIIKQVPNFLKPNQLLKKHAINQLYLEIGYKQKVQVVALMQDAGYTDIQVFVDMNKKDRVVSGSI